MGISNKAVITLGVNAPPPRDHPVIQRDFFRGIQRVRKSLVRQRFSGGFIYWCDQLPEGCPRHEEVPFAFKPFCFGRAQELGYHAVLWLDASILIQCSLQTLFERIVRQGYVFFQESHSLGEFCKDEALESLHLTRSEALRTPSCTGSVIGLNLLDARAIDFLSRWKQLALDGTTFPGPKWSGLRGWPQLASTDPRVKGHRHDQTAASALALKLGMDDWLPKSAYKSFFQNERQFLHTARSGSFEKVLAFARRKISRWTTSASTPEHHVRLGE